MYKQHTSKNNIPKWLKGLFFLGLVALFTFVLGQIIMFLWNEILVEVAGVKTLSFWQAIGLFVLARILFGGFHFGPKIAKWKARKARWREKWANMSEEERLELKKKWRERCAKRPRRKETEE